MIRALVLLGVAVSALILAAMAAAAKSQPDSLSLIGNAVYGATISFDVRTSEPLPNVNVRCYQSGVFVYDGWGAFWPGAAVGRDFTLSSGYWMGGAADCLARLVVYDKQGRERVLARLEFPVAG